MMNSIAWTVVGVLLAIILLAYLLAHLKPFP